MRSNRRGGIASPIIVLMNVSDDFSGKSIVSLIELTINVSSRLSARGSENSPFLSFLPG